MLLALPLLSHEGFSVNAHGCRQYPEALAILRGLRHAHELPRVVVIDLGANGAVSEGDVTGALQILGHERLLVLVTPRELGGGSGSDAQLIRAEGRRHPERVRVLDWVAYSAGHPDWFEPDGLHVSPRGSAAQAQLLARVLPLDATPRSVPSPHCPLPAPVPAAQAPLTGVAFDPAGGVLDVRLHSSRVKLTLINPAPFVLGELVRVRESLPGGLTIAARCVSAAAQSRTAVLLTLSARALAELELHSRYRVRVELVPSAARGFDEAANRDISARARLALSASASCSCAGAPSRSLVLQVTVRTPRRCWVCAELSSNDSAIWPIESARRHEDIDGPRRT